MAYLNATATTYRTGESRIAAFFGDIVARLRRYRTYRQTFYALDALTDRDLADLGLSRSQLRSVAWDSADTII